MTAPDQPTSFYSDLPATAFWRSTAASRAPEETDGFYEPRFRLDKATSRIFTAGSCFAQHVGRALGESGYNVIDTERLAPTVPRAIANRFGYAMYSARYGNIYTARQMRQLLEEVYDGRTLAHPVWSRGERFHDAQRPGVDPDGLDTPGQVKKARVAHLARVRLALEKANVFVFTLGLTEAWTDAQGTTVYPTAPGTIAGRHDPAQFRFRNFDVFEVIEDFEAVLSRLKTINPEMKVLITVSPVPLTATASGRHVEVATAESKAILRAACATLVSRHDNIDYFPSYEIVTAQAARGAFFEPNLRSVTGAGVATAMRTFLRAQGEEVTDPSATDAAPAPGRPRAMAAEEAICEEALLEAFAR